jgi:hypothetical protein
MIELLHYQKKKGRTSQAYLEERSRSFDGGVSGLQRPMVHGGSRDLIAVPASTSLLDCYVLPEHAMLGHLPQLSSSCMHAGTIPAVAVVELG